MLEEARDRARVYRFVGKAVLLTSITAFVAFFLFSGPFGGQTDLLVRQTLLATALAVVVMWLATMLVVPLFYPPPRRGASHAMPPAGAPRAAALPPGTAPDEPMRAAGPP